MCFKLFYQSSILFQQKHSPWQGAVRSAASIWSDRLQYRQRVSDQMVHITDWLPTFAKIAGVEINDQIDGIDVWDALSNNKPSPRREILVHYDGDKSEPFMAYIRDNFKLISGTTNKGQYDGWLSDPTDSSEQNATFGEFYGHAILSSNAGKALSKYSKMKRNQYQTKEISHLQIISTEGISEIRSKAQVTCNGHKKPEPNSINACNPLETVCLFDILNDPCETTNVASEFPEIVSKLKEKLDYYGSVAKPPRNQPLDTRSDPANFGGIWTWWYDLMKYTSSKVSLTFSRIFSYIDTYQLYTIFDFVHSHF